MLIILYCIPDRFSNFLSEYFGHGRLTPMHWVIQVSLLAGLTWSHWPKIRMEKRSVFSPLFLLQHCFSSGSCVCLWLKFPLVAPFPRLQLSLNSDDPIFVFILSLWMITDLLPLISRYYWEIILHGSLMFSHILWARYQLTFVSNDLFKDICILKSLRK